MAEWTRAMSGLTRRGAMKAGVAGAALGTLARPVLAQTPAPEAVPFLTNLPGRERTALDGTWKVILDPFDVAGRKPSKRRSFWLDTAETRETGLVEYEWASSDEMQLPAAWNDVTPELTYYEGPAYFRRLLDASPRPGIRQFLHFEAVNYAATVWLNGVEIARHEGGFTPFAVEITDLLARAGAGPHSLVVRADSRHGADSVPGLDFDWKNRGGITRSVWLVAVPETHIRDSYARLEGEALAIDVTLDGPAREGQTVVAALAGRSARAVSDAGGRAQLRIAAKGLARWSPAAPVLHDLTLTAASDRLTERIGLRSIATRGREILLNGKPVFLRGISMHEEAFGPEGARAVSMAEARALLSEAKALGCNFVRLAHYPHADHVARLADEMGLMLWAEIPVYWEEIDYASPRTLALARAMMGELVLRDRSRASVVMWSVANETPQSEARLRFLQTVIADVRALDPSRLVTAALNKNVDVGGVRDGESVIEVRDPLGASLDVVAINQYEGWYGTRTPAEIAGVSFRNTYDKPLMFSEFGADALYGQRGPREDRWSEDYQAWLYEETLKVIERTPGCVGLAPWVLKDFRSPRRWHGRFQDMWNRKGLLSPEGRRKAAFFVLQDFYRRKAAP
ncbi:hypothetical protein CHX26_04725 [Porphyrobacter sp. HT-58-2]|uniref:glycoside hydrolase family 2 protein n=1 Tax=Porphyrobacter sp. HT-58-2 TaxID=2023229 RepID=UPI000CDC2AB5|nr:glycoside hydrolase family 2 TIM barrel-domain containing protein [Porphyrobacter sp. HT-58-2]AUX68910.1 hypothetical protein CHX26_04725 [Porphyrobacter sp. HT-58-2]